MVSSTATAYVTNGLHANISPARSGTASVLPVNVCIRDCYLSLLSILERGGF